jgi:hypothetical protein
VVADVGRERTRGVDALVERNPRRGFVAVEHAAHGAVDTGRGAQDLGQLEDASRNAGEALDDLDAKARGVDPTVEIDVDLDAGKARKASDALDDIDRKGRGMADGARISIAGTVVGATVTECSSASLKTEGARWSGAATEERERLSADISDALYFSCSLGGWC